MSDIEGEPTPPEGEKTSEPANEVASSSKYPNAMAGISAGLAFIANVESIAGWDAASTITLRTAGAVAVGAACGAVMGFVRDRNN